MKKLVALLKKDLLLEVRSGESISLMLFLGLLMATVMSFAIESVFIPGVTVARIFPALVWVLFMIIGALAIGRSFEAEARYEGLDGLLLTGTSPALIYLSKCVVGIVITLIGQCCSVAALAIFLNVDLSNALLPLFLIIALTSIGYTALAILFSAITLRSRLRQLLLPLILLPLVFPLFLCALELSSVLLDSSYLATDSVWFSLLIALDLIYLMLGINLFEYVVRE